MPTNPTAAAEDLAAIQQTFSGIGLDPNTHGAAADAMRQALAQHGADLAAITAAARAVAQAADERARLIATRDVEMPSDDEIRNAQEAVVLAAKAAADGTGSSASVSAATDRLSDLLAQKKAAQDKFNHGEKQATATLDKATTDLPDATGGSPLSGAGLGPLLSALSQFKPPPMPALGAPMSGMPAGGADPSAGVPATLASDLDHTADPAALLDALEPGAGGNASYWGPGSALDDPNWADGAGQTHTSADEMTPMPTIAGAQTGADVSGRPANPFTVMPAATSTPTGTSPTGMPMAPMGPMGSMANMGVAPGKSASNKTIINQDPDFTGADIDTDIATSGVVGLGENRRTRGK